MKGIIAGAAVAVLLGLVAAAAAGDHPKDPPGGGHTPVTVCHKPGTPAQQELTFDDDGWEAHIGHGDTAGPCPAPPVDVCPNLEGNQATVPPGYTLVDGQCVQVPQPLPLAAGVTFTEATCTSGPTFTLVKTMLPGIGSRPFYNVEGPLVDGKPVAGGSYTITAIPVPGYTFTGQTVWNHTFAPAPTNCSTPPPPPPPHVVTGSADVYCDLPSQTYILRGTVDGQAADSVSPATLPGGVRGTFNVTVTRGDTSFRTSVFVYGDCVKPTTPTTTTTTTQSTTTPPPPVVSSTTTTKPAAAKPPKTQTTSKPKAAKPPKPDKPPVKLTGNPKKDKCVKTNTKGVLNCQGITVTQGAG